MKRILLLLGIITMIVAAETVLAQNQGVINYEVKVDLHRLLPADQKEMKEMMPQYRTHKDQLVFAGPESLYKNVEEEEEDAEAQFDQGGGQVRMVIRRPSTEVYSNQTTSQRLLLQDLMGKRYLVKDSIRISPWKLGTETKTILNYTCKQASYFDEVRKQQIVAWYTDQLPPFLGPETFNTLPGAVLMIDINVGERTITATQVEFRELKKNELKVPSGGTETTPEEFRKIVEEQRARMQMNGGGGGNWIIRN